MEASARGVQTDARGEFQLAAGTPAEAPAAFEFESGGFSYHVAANGNGRRVKGDRTRRYNLHLNGGESIRRLYFTEYGDDLLLLCEVDGGEAGPSVFITRLEQPSMRALWRQSAPTGGVEVLRRGGTLYLGGAGFVARLELKNGAYVWQHRDRREAAAEEGGDRDSDDRDSDREADDRESVKRREAEALIPPGRYAPAEVTGDTVVFGPARGSAEQGAKTVRVNSKTGRIVSVE
ncbi:MAG TPA: hypothetical protein VJ866_19740 [Pyrinomonadaceae bacterium]|nr:hypothetical protein [Pyrinomonadaceae bacterium]